MHIHLHNDPRDGMHPLSMADWQAVCGALHAPATLTIGASRDDYLRHAAAVDVVMASPHGLRTLQPLDSPRLRVIQCTWAGLDSLAPFDWLPSGALLLNASGIHAAKGGEYVLMGLLMLANRMPMHVAAAREQRWQPAYGRCLAGRTVVIVGLGAIGGGAAERCAALGMRVIGVRRSPRPVAACAEVITPAELDGWLPRADYLVLAMPLNAGTGRLIDARRLALLPPHAGIVNVGRGQTIDETALCDLLDAGRLGGAVLDVVCEEPAPPASRLWRTRNLILTPHVSCDELESENRLLLELLIANLNALEAGKPAPNAFDPASGTRLRT